MAIEIRILMQDDYNDAMNLWETSEGIGLNDVDDSPQGFARFLQRNPESCFAAVDDGLLVGVILAGHDGRRGHIYHAAVRSDCRRRGIGTQLVKAAMDALRGLGITKVALVAFRHNDAGNLFWEKVGFTSRDDLVYRNMTLLETRRQ